jgi:serine/threonine protein kinase
MKALKRVNLNKKLCYNKKYSDYIKEEPNLLKPVVRNRFIVKMREVIYDNKNGLLYLIMEYIPNGKLLNTINSETLTKDKVWKYFRNILSCVEYCMSSNLGHEILNICHRDIHAGNLLFNNFGTLTLCDFGVSAIMSNDGYVISDQLYPTKPPEKKEPKYLGRPFDLWYCGYCLYHLVYKEPPAEVYDNIVFTSILQ